MHSVGRAGKVSKTQSQSLLLLLGVRIKRKEIVLLELACGPGGLEQVGGSGLQGLKLTWKGSTMQCCHEASLPLDLRLLRVRFIV